MAIFISYAFLYCGDNQRKIRIIADGKTEKRETNKVSRRNDLNSMCSDSKHLGFLHFSTAATLFRLLPEWKESENCVVIVMLVHRICDKNRLICINLNSAFSS